MATATPSIEAVIDGVAAVLGAVGGLGTIEKRYHRFEDDLEHIELGGYIVGGSMDLWLIDVDHTGPFAGEGTGEDYDRYHIRIRYWSLRTNNADWQKEARVKAQSAIDALTDHPSVFEIGNQQQLHTPTTVRLQGPDQRDLRDDASPDGRQMVYEALLELQAEARRWA